MPSWEHRLFTSEEVLPFMKSSPTEIKDERIRSKDESFEEFMEEATSNLVKENKSFVQNLK